MKPRPFPPRTHRWGVVLAIACSSCGVDPTDTRAFSAARLATDNIALEMFGVYGEVDQTLELTVLLREDQGVNASPGTLLRLDEGDTIAMIDLNTGQRFEAAPSEFEEDGYTFELGAVSPSVSYQVELNRASRMSATDTFVTIPGGFVTTSPLEGEVYSLGDDVAFAWSFEAPPNSGEEPAVPYLRLRSECAGQRYAQDVRVPTTEGLSGQFALSAGSITEGVPEEQFPCLVTSMFVSSPAGTGEFAQLRLPITTSFDPKLANQRRPADFHPAYVVVNARPVPFTVIRSTGN